MLPWHTFEWGDVVEAGPLRMTAFEAAHSCTDVMLRIEADGRVLSYTGDTGPHPSLAKGAADADLFLCEASWLEEEPSIPEPIHLRARQAGEIATQADARKLVLTHIWPKNDLDLVREQAAAAYSGSLELADIGKSWTV